MEITDEYKCKVEADYKQRGFTLCSFKGKNDWFEILDSNFNWDKFDYKIPDYNKPKTGDDLISDVDKNFDSFHF